MCFSSKAALQFIFSSVKFGVVFALCSSAPQFSPEATVSLGLFCPFCCLFFHQHFVCLVSLPTLLLPSVPQLVSPFRLFSLSRPVFSRDALKLLVFLLLLLLHSALYLSKLLWMIHPGWSVLDSSHLLAFPPPPISTFIYSVEEE